MCTFNYTSSVKCLHYLNETTLISGSNDGSIKLIENGMETVMKQSAQIWCIDSKEPYFVCGSGDGYLKVVLI